MESSEAARAIWALYVETRNLDDLSGDALLAARKISGAARALFPVEHNRFEAKRWYERNPDRARAYRLSHSDDQRRYRETYREQHPDRVAQWAVDNRELKRQIDRSYRARNRDEILARRREREPAQRRARRAAGVRKP